MSRKRKAVKPTSRKAEKILAQIESSTVFGKSKLTAPRSGVMAPVVHLSNYRETTPVPSSTSRVHNVTIPNEPRYTGDFLKREQEAQKEIAIKKTRVAPLYNKGAGQYLDPSINPKDIGRKTNQLED